MIGGVCAGLVGGWVNQSVGGQPDTGAHTHFFGCSLLLVCTFCVVATAAHACAERMPTVTAVGASSVDALLKYTHASAVLGM